jgi:hypothetical protein
MQGFSSRGAVTKYDLADTKPDIGEANVYMRIPTHIHEPHFK